MSTGNFIALAAASAAMIAVVVGWFQTNATLRQNRELTDLEAVRAVLDTAVTELRVAASAIARIQELSPASGSTFSSACNSAAQTNTSLGSELERLRVRFGSAHPATRYFYGALLASINAVAAAEEMIGNIGIAIRTSEVIEEEKALEELRIQIGPVIDREAERFRQQRSHFLEQAYTVGQARLAEPDG